MGNNKERRSSHNRAKLNRGSRNKRGTQTKRVPTGATSLRLWLTILREETTIVQS
jgi:hypothetical protein